MRRRVIQCAVAAAVFIAGGCDRPARQNAGAPASTQQAAPAPTNRINVPPTVRQNLGITFARVERRRVASTIRVPGRFELLPTARQEYRSTFPGWVRPMVTQYEQVKKGAVVFEVDSPEWHKLRKQLHEAQAAIEKATAELAVAEKAKAEAETAIKTLERRVEELAGAQVRRAELETELTTRRASIPRFNAEIQLKRAELNEARHDFSLEIDTVAAMLGVTSKYLLETVEQPTREADHHDDKTQRWFTLDKVKRIANSDGIVESLHAAPGAWVEANALIASVINPNELIFRGTGLQSDLGRLKDGLSVQIIPPQGSGIDRTDVLPGQLKVGLTGNPDDRTIELVTLPQKVSSWTKPGVSALMEIAIDDSGGEELAIPLSAVVKDELTHIFYRRDPNNPDKVIRLEADMGVSDGKWVVIQSGIKAGDEVVLEGAYELKLAGGGKAMGGGHFHADGSWHAEPDK